MIPGPFRIPLILLLVFPSQTHFRCNAIDPLAIRRLRVKREIVPALPYATN